MIWIHYALRTPSPEVTISPVEQFGRDNPGLINVSLVVLAVLAIFVPVYLDIRKERKAKKDHGTIPKKIWLRRVWFWATDKWKRLRTPLDGRADVRTQLIEVQAENRGLRSERDFWARDHELTKDRLLKAQGTARDTQAERQSALGHLDVARYELRAEKARNVQLGKDLGAVTRERDDLREKKSFLESMIEDLGEEQMQHTVRIKDLTSQLQTRDTEIELLRAKDQEAAAPVPVDFKAPDIDPEWFITGDDEGLRLQHLGGDTARHVYIKAAHHDVAVTGGRMDPMFEGGELQFAVRPRYAHLGYDGRGFYVHWTDAKGEQRFAHLEAHVEEGPPF